MKNFFAHSVDDFIILHIVCEKYPTHVRLSKLRLLANETGLLIDLVTSTILRTLCTTAALIGFALTGATR